MKFILSINALIFIIRLATVLSNMDSDLVSPMQYPEMFMDVKTKFLVPWVEKIYDKGVIDKSQLQWLYWLTILNFEIKLPKLSQEFLTIFLGYVYYQTCHFWLLSENFEVWISEETKEKVNKYYENQATILSLVKQSNAKSQKLLSDSDFDLLNSDYSLNIPDDMNSKLKELLLTSRRYRFYKMMQRMSNIYYSKLMVMMIMILSILSNTLFSLGYILLLCSVMYLSKLFYDVESARTILLPLLKKFVVPYMLFEIIL